MVGDWFRSISTLIPGGKGDSMPSRSDAMRNASASALARRSANQSSIHSMCALEYVTVSRNHVVWSDWPEVIHIFDIDPGYSPLPPRFVPPE